MSFSCLAAIPLMPIGDLIVISFTSPVLSVFFDRIVLKRLLTFLSICLCLLIVLGDVLVVQPPFIFGEEDSVTNTTSNSLKPLEEETILEKHGQFYYLGVALCFYAAAAGAVANVVGAQCNKMNISTSQLMLVSGFSSLILALISTIFLPNRLLTDPLSLSLQAAILLPVSAVITMIAYWTITLAVSVTRHPTLISMLRSTEIIISLFTEALWWHQLPGTLSLLGSLMVAACVLSMAAHDKIATAASTAWRKCRGRKGKESKNIVTML
jgi:drug/metabolite transporter (DMT)-like permease